MKVKLLITLILVVFITFKSEGQKEAEIVFSSKTVRAGNIAISNSGRMFISINPLVGSEIKILEIGKDGSSKPYPNKRYSKGKNSIISASIGIRIDSRDNLWILDMKLMQFVVWNINDEKLVKIIKLPKNVLKPASFLQDFVIDEKHNRIIIADMTQGDLVSDPSPAFIVLNINNNKAIRMAEKHKSMMPDFKGGFALNPIAIDPKNKWIYFGALHGRKLYRVATKDFISDEALSKGIKEYSIKSYCDGIATDNFGNVYVTNVENHVLSVTNNKIGLRTIATLPIGQTWPDGLYIKNGYLYSTVDQLNRLPALNKGLDDSKSPYIIVRTKININNK
ncbi:hypothetical protein E0494_02560 [Marinilabiliaceae bacterium JC040]|nr:hypothetical protein [Marinilabiliaceae bacterium JC040]